MNPLSNSRLKDEFCEHYTLVHTKVCPHAQPHAAKGSKALNQDMQYYAKGDRALACPVLSSLVLGKGEHGGLLHGISQSLPVQIVLEQKKMLCMMETPYSHVAAEYHQPADDQQQFGAATEPQSRSAEDMRMLTGIGAPYMSLNFHQVLGKPGPIKASPVASLSNITDGHCYQGKEMVSYNCTSQSPSSSSSPESHRETPHCTGTSVIITNER